MVLFARQEGKAKVSGHLIDIMQTALTAQGFGAGGIDGIFGKRTEDALRLWQTHAGLPATGVLTTDEWQRLTGLPVPSLRDLCIQISAAIEGHGFHKVAGNHDGAGLTWGYLGFALTGTLGELLKRIHDHPTAGTRARAIFGQAQWRKLLAAAQGSKREKLAFADSLSTGERKLRLQSTWEAAFARLGAVPEVQQLQLAATGPVWEACLAADENLQAPDALALAMLYDACAQHGALPYKRAALMQLVLRDQDALSLRRGWAEAIARATGPRIRARVKERAMLFAEGAGRVKGADYDLAHWGFGAELSQSKAYRGMEVSALPDGFQDDLVHEKLTSPQVLPAADWLSEVALPRGINAGLRHASNAYVMAHLGLPRGDFGPGSRQPTDPHFRALCDFGFRYKQLGRVDWALRPARESFAEVLEAIARRKPALYALLGHAGMGSCRYVRGSSAAISNHAFGIAIDITIAGQLNPFAHGRITRGMLEVIRIAQEFKWFSGITFRREDAMHLEVSQELLDSWRAAGRLPVKSPVDPLAQQVQLGHRGEEVQDLQHLLNRAGAGLKSDGLFGTATASALKCFQHQRGLMPTGIADMATTLALQEVEIHVA